MAEDFQEASRSWALKPCNPTVGMGSNRWPWEISGPGISQGFSVFFLGESKTPFWTKKNASEHEKNPHQDVDMVHIS